MQIKMTDHLLTYIAVKYPGGSDQFKKDGGVITATPRPSHDIVVCHPKLPSDIKKAVEGLSNTIIQTVPNFKEIFNRHVIVRDLSKKLEKLDPTITVTDSPAVLFVTSPMKYDQKLYEEIAYLLGDIKELSLSYILWKNGYNQEKGKAWRDSEDDIDNLLREASNG